MNVTKLVRAFAVVGCLSMLLPGAALSASFGEVAGGVKNMTEAAKDVNDIRQSKPGKNHSTSRSKATQPASQKKAEKQKPAKKQTPSKQQRRAAPQQEERMRGG